MIDYFALALTHGLLLVALLRLVQRADVDQELEPGSMPDAPGDTSRDDKAATGGAARRRARRKRRDA